MTVLEQQFYELVPRYLKRIAENLEKLVEAQIPKDKSL